MARALRMHVLPQACPASRGMDVLGAERLGRCCAGPRGHGAAAANRLLANGAPREVGEEPDSVRGV